MVVVAMDDLEFDMEDEIWRLSLERGYSVELILNGDAPGRGVDVFSNESINSLSSFAFQIFIRILSFTTCDSL